MGASERSRRETAQMGAAADLPSDETCGLENADVLGSGGQRHGAGRREVADAARAVRKLPQHGATGAVPEGVEDGVKIGGISFNHTV